MSTVMESWLDGSLRGCLLAWRKNFSASTETDQNLEEIDFRVSLRDTHLSDLRERAASASASEGGRHTSSKAKRVSELEELVLREQGLRQDIEEELKRERSLAATLQAVIDGNMRREEMAGVQGLTEVEVERERRLLAEQASNADRGVSWG